MPEAQRVQELVLHGAQAVAVPADGQPLLPLAPVPHRGEATVHRPQTERESFFTLARSSMSSSELRFIAPVHRSFVVLAIDYDEKLCCNYH